MHQKETRGAPALRLLAWETTRRCNLACLHCRAAAGSGPYPGELMWEINRIGADLMSLKLDS